MDEQHLMGMAQCHQCPQKPACPCRQVLEVLGTSLRGVNVSGSLPAAKQGVSPAKG